VATCSVDCADLGEWLVRNGLALDWPQYSKGRYDAAQQDAEHVGRGIWKGSYVEPWLYRVCIRANGTPANCSEDVPVSRATAKGPQLEVACAAVNAPKLLSIGLHDRLIGRPGRCAGLIKLLEYMRGQEGVWFCRGIDIAEHWRSKFPTSPV
jgi:hypothetical protein